jgi:ribosomal protein S10
MNNYKIKKAAKKQTDQAEGEENLPNNRQHFRLIKNENWQPPRKPKVRMKSLPCDLPPAA